MTKFICLLGLSVFFLSSCKKDSANNPDSTPTVDASGNINVSSDADGACYAIKTRIYDNNSGTANEEFYSAYAWFGSVSSFKDGGAVKANGNEITFISGINTYTYTDFGNLFPSNNVQWELAGNSSTGIPGFNYTDNTAFPSGGDFTLPAVVNIGSTLTINFAAVNNVTAIVFSIQGNKGRKSKAVANGGSSVSFSPDEMNEVAYSNDVIAVSIMPVVMVPQTLGGKKIYFVKQYQYARETETL